MPDMHRWEMDADGVCRCSTCQRLWTKEDRFGRCGDPDASLPPEDYGWAVTSSSKPTPNERKPRPPIPHIDLLPSYQKKETLRRFLIITGLGDWYGRQRW